jgi:hypothetical protein
MAGEPVIIGASGWRKLFDYPAGIEAGRRVRLLMGPASTISAAMSAVAAELACESIEPSVSVGSAVASLRVTYSTDAIATLSLGERRPPVFSIQPMLMGVDLRAHPALKSIQSVMPDIEKRINEGDVAGISSTYAANALALKFARLMIAGVNQYEAVGFNLAVTRYYTSPPTIADDYVTIGKVALWGDIRTDGKPIPGYVQEPKAHPISGSTPVPMEWRLVSVAPVIVRREVNVVQWQFAGLEAWAAWLYPGGSWEPGTL